MTLLEPAWLVWLWVAPAAALLVVLGVRARRAQLRRLVGARLSRELTPGVRVRRVLVKGLLSVGALVLVVVALSRPGWNPQAQKVTRAGRDIAVLIDVSRSMLAEDVKPNRLERAKVIVKDMMDAAQGDRIGIIAFAGNASVRSPLTTDTSFARLALDNLTPLSVGRGGTMIGDAIRVALDEMFGAGEGMGGAEGRYRDIVLITDGEDHESFPSQAAAVAAERGVRIIAIGLGSELGGATIPNSRGTGGDDASPVVTYEGEVVRTKQESESLKRVAAATPGGVYLNVGTGNIQMDKVYRQLMARAERREMETEERVKYQEGFQVFLGAALALLVLEGLISERTRR
jgi:Ca-activated chloride channel family protein